MTHTRMKCRVCGAKIGVYHKSTGTEEVSTFNPLRSTLLRVSHRTYHHEGETGILIQVKVRCSKCKQTTTKTIKKLI